ncbi:MULTISPECIES: hypothetical protein [unclassified Acinetobacter]|nr:hypothetical protein [Acinetobacter sp. ANC 4218]
MSDIQTTLLQVESLLKNILDSQDMTFEQAYALKKLSVELKKISVK